MTIETKKKLYFASTIFGAMIIFPSIIDQLVREFESGGYAYFSRPDMLWNLNTDSLVALSLVYLFISIPAFFYACYYLKPYSKMTKIGIILNIFFILSFTFLILRAGLTSV
jgi:hypothetical protein